MFLINEKDAVSKDSAEDGLNPLNQVYVFNLLKL